MATTVNLEAEQLAIITILNAKEATLSGKLLGTLGSDDFGSDAANEVMAKMLGRLRAGRDVPRRKVFCMDHSLSDDARDFLRNIQIKPLTEDSSVDGLIETLRFHRKVRRIISTARDMVEACKTATVDTTHQLESKLDQLTLELKGNESTSKIVTFGSGDRAAADDVMRRVVSPEDAKRIRTGFGYFDSRAGGFRKGHAVLIAGPSGGGKSALANQLLINMYQKPPHYKTLFVSFEMDDEECAARMCANVAGLEFSKVEQKKLNVNETALLMREIDRFHQIGIDNEAWFRLWSPDEDLTASNVISYCRPLAPDVLVVDYIGLLGQDNPREEQWRSLGNAMRQFKVAAKKLQCCVIVLAQFDQDAMVVKYARALREHANIMWCWTYGPEEEAQGHTTVMQTAPYGKNRNCPPFNFRLKYELKLMRIHDMGEADLAEAAKAQKPKGGDGRNPVKRVKINKSIVEWEDE